MCKINLCFSLEIVSSYHKTIKQLCFSQKLSKFLLSLLHLCKGPRVGEGFNPFCLMFDQCGDLFICKGLYGLCSCTQIFILFIGKWISNF